MGEVVASIKCARGRPTIKGWLESEGMASTPAIAHRFDMTVDEARRTLRRLAKHGDVRQVRPVIGYDRNVNWWEAT